MLLWKLGEWGLWPSRPTVGAAGPGPITANQSPVSQLAPSLLSSGGPRCFEVINYAIWQGDWQDLEQSQRQMALGGNQILWETGLLWREVGLYVCLCVCMCIHMYACVCACVFVYPMLGMWERLCMGVCVCACAYVCLCMPLYAHILCVSLCVGAGLCACVYGCVPVRAYVCLCVGGHVPVWGDVGTLCAYV